MLKFVLLTFVTLAIAIGGGAASVWYALAASRDFGAIDVGSWTATPDFGTPQANPYSRASFARESGLSLGQAEGISFDSKHDSSGAKGLSANCNYVIEGPVPAYPFLDHLCNRRLGKAIAPCCADGPCPAIARLAQPPRLACRISRSGQTRPPATGLAVPRGGSMRLVLTLFDTPVSGETDILDIELPTITRSGCDD